LAQSGYPNTRNQCPLSGVKRTSDGLGEMSAFDPKRTLTGAKAYYERNANSRFNIPGCLDPTFLLAEPIPAIGVRGPSTRLWSPRP